MAPNSNHVLGVVGRRGEDERGEVGGAVHQSAKLPTESKYPRIVRLRQNNRGLHYQHVDDSESIPGP